MRALVREPDLPPYPSRLGQLVDGPCMVALAKQNGASGCQCHGLERRSFVFLGDSLQLLHGCPGCIDVTPG